MKVTIEYSDLEKFKYFCKQNDIKIEKEEYFEKIQILLKCNMEQSEIFLQKEIKSGVKLIESAIIQKTYVKKSVVK